MATAVHGEDGGGSAGASAEGNQGDAALVFTDPAGRGAEIISMNKIYNITKWMGCSMRFNVLVSTETARGGTGQTRDGGGRR